MDTRNWRKKQENKHIIHPDYNQVVENNHRKIKMYWIISSCSTQLKPSSLESYQKSSKIDWRRSYHRELSDFNTTQNNKTQNNTKQKLKKIKIKIGWIIFIRNSHNEERS